MRRRLQHAGISMGIDAMLKRDMGADAIKFREHMDGAGDAFTAFHTYTKSDLDAPPPRSRLDMARSIVADSTKLKELCAELLEVVVRLEQKLIVYVFWPIKAASPFHRAPRWPLVDDERRYGSPSSGGPNPVSYWHIFRHARFTLSTVSAPTTAICNDCIDTMLADDGLPVVEGKDQAALTSAVKERFSEHNKLEKKRLKTTKSSRQTSSR